MSKLIETLAFELERPRELSPRVLNYIGGTYNIDHDAIGAFLADQSANLEDYEIDLILSPPFTPKLADQAVFADLLGSESVPPEQCLALVQELAARPVRAQLITPDKQVHSVRLREVTIERYVHRLRLEGSIAEPLANLIERTSPPDGHSVLRAIARRAVWENDGARDILVRYLRNAGDRGSYTLGDSVELLDLAETRKPANVSDLLARIPAWREALRQQIEVAGGKPFFSEEVRALHGGGRDQRQLQDDARMLAKQNEFEFLGRLQQVLAG